MKATVTQIAISCLCWFIGAIAISAVLGNTRENLWWILGAVMVVPLATWAGLLLKKYLFRTR